MTQQPDRSLRRRRFPMVLIGLALLTTPPAVAATKPKPAADEARVAAHKPAADEAPAPAAKPAAKVETKAIAANAPPSIETAAKFAYAVDVNTGTVLLDKNADQRMAPSSMTKMLTAYVVFDRLKRGDLKLDDELPVSEKAWRTQGSKMFVELGAKIKVSDLVRGMIISSGNDACIVLAEGVSGSEEAFADELNKTARKLGMADTNYRNPDGMPDPDHYTTAHDLAIVAERTIADFPEFYPIYGEKEFLYHGIKQGNRNPLLYEDATADGLKTGHTDEGGFGLTGSSLRNGRRIVVVLNGMASMKERSQESAKVMEWAFREFDDVTLFKAGDVVDQADVWLGAEKTVPMVASGALTVTLPRRARRDMKVVMQYDNPVPAPIRQGDVIGRLTITAPGVTAMTLPLAAGADVAKVGVFGRAGAAMSYLLFGRRA